jgi:hypothetical protein
VSCEVSESAGNKGDSADWKDSADDLIAVFAMILEAKAYILKAC